jgi:5-methyltetrahydrofolate--homocysteine methyltransferase
MNGYLAALEEGNKESADELIKQSIRDGLSAGDILRQQVFPAMETIGKKFKNNEIYIPEMIMIAQIVNSNLHLLKPHWNLGQGGQEGKIVLGTVKGDLHDIGKNIVKMVAEGSGFEVIDLGVDVSKEKYLAAIREHQPQILALSALLTTTMLEMKGVMEALRESGLSGKVKTIIGGACVSQRFADEIGADLYARDASEGVEKIRGILSR